MSFYSVFVMWLSKHLLSILGYRKFKKKQKVWYGDGVVLVFWQLGFSWHLVENLFDGSVFFWHQTHFWKERSFLSQTYFFAKIWIFWTWDFLAKGVLLATEVLFKKGVFWKAWSFRHPIKIFTNLFIKPDDYGDFLEDGIIQQWGPCSAWEEMDWLRGEY